MTWPFENDTSAVVKKLAKRNLTADRTRNILIVMTIAFAACLIMATALYAIGTQRASRNHAAGMYQANISGLDDETACAIQNDDRVLAGFSFFLGMLDHGEYKVTVRSMDENLIRLAKYPALTGRLPETENEVAVTQALLDREGFTVQVGDTIPLALTGARQHYTVCGILPVTDSNYSIFVTPALIKEHAENPVYSAYINVQGTDGLPEESIKACIQSLAGEWGVDSKDVDFSGYYFALIRQRSLEYMTAVLFVIIIVILACVLVIYSLFFVSIIKKTNEYGKLRTIGTTARQVRRIVMKEGRSLSKIGIPIGLILGAAAGYALVPSGWAIHTVLIAGALVAVLMYLCIMLAVRHPAKLASKVTPIEAIRYSAGKDEVTAKSTKRLRRSLSDGRLALINFSRNKKKTILTVASLGICGILLMASSAYFNSIDPVNVARGVFPYGQVRIELGDYGSQSHSSEEFVELQGENPLSPGLTQRLAEIDGVKDMRVYRGTVLNVTTPTGYENPFLADAFSVDRQALLEEYLIAGTADLQELTANNGVVIKQSSQLAELFDWEVSIGDQLTIQAGTGERKEVTVMGIVDESIPYGGYELIYMPLETLSVLMPAENLNYQVLLDTADSDWEQVREEVRRLLPENARLYVTALNDWAENYKGLLANYRTPVYLFVLLIGVFGALNLLNTLITNVLTRKRELGVLQAVGMGRRQVSKMLLTEGLLYTAGAFVLSISFGTLFGVLLCRVFSAMSVFGEVSYHFPVWEMTGFFSLMLAVQIAFSFATIKQLRSQSLVEQIRELS